MTFKLDTLEILRKIIVFHREFTEQNDRYPTIGEVAEVVDIGYPSSCRFSRTFWLKFQKRGVRWRWDKSPFSTKDIEQIKGHLSEEDYDYFKKVTLRPLPKNTEVR